MVASISDLAGKNVGGYLNLIVWLIFQCPISGGRRLSVPA